MKSVVSAVWCTPPSGALRWETVRAPLHLLDRNCLLGAYLPGVDFKFTECNRIRLFYLEDAFLSVDLYVLSKQRGDGYFLVLVAPYGIAAAHHSTLRER